MGKTIPDKKNNKKNKSIIQDLHKLIKKEGSPLESPNVINSHYLFLEKRVKRVFEKIEIYSFNIKDVEFLYMIIKLINRKESGGYTSYEVLNFEISKDPERVNLPQYYTSTSSPRDSIYNYYKKFSDNLKIIKYDSNTRIYFLDLELLITHFGVGIVELFYILNSKLKNNSIRKIVYQYPLPKYNYVKFDEVVKEMEIIEEDINPEDSYNDEILINSNNEIITRSNTNKDIVDKRWKYLKKKLKKYQNLRKEFDYLFTIPTGWYLKIPTDKKKKSASTPETFK